MITAKNILDKNEISGFVSKIDEYTITHTMIEFAKLHVEAALKAASENVFTDCDEDNNIIADKGSILKAYPLENIK